MTDSTKDIATRLHADAASDKAAADALTQRAADEEAAALALEQTGKPASPPPVNLPPTTSPVVPTAPIGTDQPPAAPSPGAAPGTAPAPAPVVNPRAGTFVGKDGDAFTVATAGRYSYGVAGHLIEIHLKPGAYRVLPTSMGCDDPAYGIVKQLYRIADEASTAAPPAAPAPAPTPLPADFVLSRAAYEDLVKLRPGFPASYFSSATLSALATSYPAGVPGEMTYDEPATGYRDEIGIRAWASQVWAITLDPRAEAHMLANADCSKSFPIHQTQNGDIPKPWIYNDGDPLEPDPVGNPAIVVDVSHEPGFLFDALMNRGIAEDWVKFDEYLRELKAWVSYNFRQFPGSARQYHKGIFNAVQQRAQAWSLARLAQLLFVLQKFRPDDEWMPWVRSCFEENIRFLDGVYRTGTYDTSGFVPYYDRELDAYKNEVGITGQGNLAYGRGADGLTAIIAPWQQAFHSSVICWTFLLELDVSADVRALHEQLAKWTSRFVVMLFGKPDDPASFDYRRNGQYNMEVGKYRAAQGQAADSYQPRAITFYSKPAEFFAPILAALGPLPPDDHDLRDGNASSGLATRYDDNNVPALTMAVEVNADNAPVSFGRFKATNQFMSGGSIPFSYLPKGEQYGVRDATSPTAPAVPPVVDPTPNPPAVPVVSADFPLPEGQWGPIAGWKNTIRQCLPDWLKDAAQNWTSIWPGAAFIESSDEWAMQNGGHMLVGMNATVYASLVTRSYQARNKGSGPKPSSQDGWPDADGVFAAMHGYLGHVPWPAKWGFFTGPDRYVQFTWYRDGTGTPNPIAFYDTSKEFGGGDVIYKGDRNKHFYAIGGYAVACASDFLKGWFLGDRNVSGYSYDLATGKPSEIFAFVRGDGSEPDTSWPCPIDQWQGTVLNFDEDNRLLVGISGGPSMKVVDADPASPTFKAMTQVPVSLQVDGTSWATMETDRTGFRWLSGKGYVGIAKISDTEAIGVQLVPGKNPRLDPATARVVFRGIPALPNGVWGSHVADHKRGITVLSIGPDAPPLHFNWPRVPA